MNTASLYELLQPDMTMELGSHTFERKEIIAFARKFDPQRFHVDEEAARESNFGALCASGWHTASVWMRKNVEAGRAEMYRLTGYEGADPVFGPSPGVRNLKWLAPVFVGDTITFSSTITGKRINTKRAGWGMLFSQSRGVNQRGQTVITMDGAVTIRTD